jgi:hypothetical protein
MDGKMKGLLLGAEALASALAAAEPPVSLRETLSPSALVALPCDGVALAGRVADASMTNLLLRVTTSSGHASQAPVAVRDGAFRCRYPADFADAPALAPGALFIDALVSESTPAAEATLVLYPPQGLPDLPSAFTCDLLDAAGRTDQACAEWPAVRTLANLYLQSRGARLARAERAGFDLARPPDLQWFKDHLTLYEFDHRDRDWSTPLNNRPCRTFWQSVWNTWFNPSNDHPLDGNPANRTPSNYRPYTFANDFADLLVMSTLRLRAAGPLDDNLTNLVREAAENLLAMQHRSADNFALQDATGKREAYTAGAFRYGLFEDGEWLTEGKGWFANPQHDDFRRGGVLNGRAVWALGEVLRADPQSPLAPRLREAIDLACRFCLHDGVAGGYVKRTSQGHTYWRDPGEHAYLQLGLLAAYEAGQTALHGACVDGLAALADLEKPGHLWTRYPNVDAMAIAALAEGARVLRAEPEASRWRQCAMQVADGWLNARVDPRERAVPSPHFGLRVAPERMTYVWREGGKPQFFYYQSGHWVHALADLYALTGEARYRDRAEAIVSDLCGANPWSVRLFNELGGVYNWTDDTDGDGVEDLLKQDMYPESTAFCQIGILHLIAARQQRPR